VFIDPVGTGYSRAHGNGASATGARPRTSPRSQASSTVTSAPPRGAPRRSISPARAMAAFAPPGCPSFWPPSIASRWPCIPDLAGAGVQPDQRRQPRAAARRAAPAVLCRGAGSSAPVRRRPTPWPRPSASPSAPISPRSPPRRATRR
jgi:hypothetical protein